MKTILICTSLMALTSGCIVSTKEDFNYLGRVPSYATHAPHAENCGCCSIKMLTPAPASAILEEQQSKKGINMNISKKAKSVQKMESDSKIIPSHNNRFHSFGSVVTDCLLAQQREADLRLAQIKLQRKRG